MSDPLGYIADSPTAPASRAIAITPDDGAPISVIPKAIFVGTGGDLTMRGKNDVADHLWRNVPSGCVLPFRPEYVRATGTTAADLLALY